MGKPKIVVLCGSTRFKREFEMANAEQSKLGKIVLTVCWFTHTDGGLGDEAEQIFGELHYPKIDMSDEVYVVNPLTKCCPTCGKWCQEYTTDYWKCKECKIQIVPVEKHYIGESTRKEIEYATKSGKPITYLNPVN